MMKRNLDYHIFIKSGQIYEAQKINGASHFLEHLIFSYSFFKSGFEKFLEKNSIDFNVETSTHYMWCRLSPLNNELLKKARRLIKREISNPTLDQNGFNQEKKIINEEISFRRQQPDYLGLNEFYKKVFKNTPLENPIIGTIASIKKIKLDNLLHLHKNYYKPPQAIELIYDNSKEKVNLLFNNIKQIPSVQIKQKPKKYIKNKGFSSKIVHTGWVFNKPTNKERIILDILRRIWGGMSESFIYKQLLQKLCIIYQGTAFLDHYKGLDFLFLQIFSTKPQICLNEIEEYKNFLIKGGGGEDIFKKAKEIELNYYKIPDSSVAKIIGQEFMSTGELIFPKERIKIINSIKYEEFLRVSKKLLTAKPFILVIN